MKLFLYFSKEVVILFSISHQFCYIYDNTVLHTPLLLSMCDNYFQYVGVPIKSQFV